MPVYVSDRLTATLGVVRGSPTPTRLIQWFRGSTTIAGANASTYTITSDDIGQPISVRQTETNYFGSAVATSAATEDVEVFDPSILFSASEPGVWYDPTDAANLAWRRNLLLWTQEFDNAYWVKTGLLTVSPNTAVAPDGTTTAEALTEDTSTGTHFPASASVSLSSVQVVTASVYVKANGRTTAELWVGLGNPRIVVSANLTTVVATASSTSTGSATSATIVSAGSGWYRISVTGTLGTTGNYPIGVLPNNGSGVSYTGDGTSGILVWGAQLELGSTATTYQPISDLNTEVIAQFPNATLYQDSIGSIPVYSPEQPVGLMLDKSRGLVPGSEIVTNGSFSSGLTGWTSDGFMTASLQDGGARVERTSDGSINSALYWLATMSTTARYRVSFDVLSGSGLLLFNNSINVDATVGTKTFIVNAAGAGTAMSLRCYLGAFAVVDNISVKELPGNHATQSTDVSRPLYGIVPVSGRRNLLTFSEQFDNAVWSAGGVANATYSANAGTSPIGDTTADRIVSSIATWNARNALTLTAADHTFSVWVKSNTGASQNFGLYFSGASNPVGSYVATTDWQRFTLTGTVVTTASGVGFYNGTSGQIVDLLIWGAQLETGSTATAYQKVTTDYDVTEAGVASVGYLRFDGTNDFMVSSTITPGTDKAQVFSGVRKLSDVTRGCVVEFGNLGTPTAGSFFINAPLNSGNPEYAFASGGTLVTNAIYNNASVSAPNSSVLTGLGDISGDRATLRANGTQVAQNTGDQGTGNFLAYPLYLGRRGGTSLEFNGQLFPLIVRFGPNMSSALIRTTENWVASKTAGVTLP